MEKGRKNVTIVNYNKMFEFIKKKLGIKSINYSELMRSGAIVVDVRTKVEYQSGHIKGSLNFPLDSLKSNLPKLKKNKPIITCCASGIRSDSAKSLLKAHGFDVYNGGSWTSLKSKIE